MCGTRRYKNLQHLLVMVLLEFKKKNKKLKIGPTHMKSLYVGHLYFTQVLCCEIKH